MFCCCLAVAFAPLTRAVLPPIRDSHGAADEEKTQAPLEEQAGMLTI